MFPSQMINTFFTLIIIIITSQISTNKISPSFFIVLIEFREAAPVLGFIDQFFCCNNNKNNNNNGNNNFVRLQGEREDQAADLPADPEGGGEGGGDGAHQGRHW